MAKRVSIRSVKANRHYQYEDASELLGVSIQTVRSWKGKGLYVMTDKRPHLILGEDLISFLANRQKPKLKLSFEQFWCMTCKQATVPLDRIAFYRAHTPQRGQLEAECPVCARSCYRFCGQSSLIKIRQHLEVVRN